jgi:uncharacterized protein (TIGR00251 family)
MNKPTPPDELLIAVRVKPGASRTAVGGRYDGEFGAALVVAVEAPPVEGKANDAVVRAVADAFGLRRRDVELTTLTTSRNKRLRLTGDPQRLAARFAHLLGE